MKNGATHRPLLSLLAALLVAACGSSKTSSDSVAVCSANLSGCECDAEPSSSLHYDASSPITCSAKAFPGTTCCAYAEWPGAGSCTCETNQVYCGVIPDAFTNGESGCACTTAPTNASQVVGATCYPSGTTSAGAVGTCCFGAGGCACGSGLHTCAVGLTTVDSCSAANVMAPTGACTSGTVSVSSCSGG